MPATSNSHDPRTEGQKRSRRFVWVATCKTCRKFGSFRVLVESYPRNVYLCAVCHQEQRERERSYRELLASIKPLPSMENFGD